MCFLVCNFIFIIFLEGRNDQAVTVVHVGLLHVKTVYMTCQNVLGIVSSMKDFVRCKPQLFKFLENLI